MNLLETEAFESTFGSKSVRKRPKVASYDYESMLQKAEEQKAKYEDPQHKYVSLSLPEAVAYVSLIHSSIDWFTPLIVFSHAQG